jgi:hypothetical protein
MRSQKKAETTTQRKNNYEDKVNENDNELSGLHLCVGLPGRHYGARHIHYRAGGS